MCGELSVTRPGTTRMRWLSADTSDTGKTSAQAGAPGSCSGRCSGKWFNKSFSFQTGALTQKFWLLMKFYYHSLEIYIIFLQSVNINPLNPLNMY